jgi:hypothetical protein
MELLFYDASYLVRRWFLKLHASLKLGSLQQCRLSELVWMYRSISFSLALQVSLMLDKESLLPLLISLMLDKSAFAVQLHLVSSSNLGRGYCVVQSLYCSPRSA